MSQLCGLVQAISKTVAISALCCPYCWFEYYVIMPWKCVAFPNLKPQITQHICTSICVNPVSSMTLTGTTVVNYLMNLEMAVIDKQKFSHLLAHMPSKVVIERDI